MAETTAHRARVRALESRAQHLCALVRELQIDVADQIDRPASRYASSAAMELADLVDVLRDIEGARDGYL